MKVDKHNSNGSDSILTAGAWSGWTSGKVRAEVGGGVGVGSGSRR